MLDDRKIPYSEMPTLDRKKLRSRHSAADSVAVTAISGMASNGCKCSETGLQQQMNAGAELNFNVLAVQGRHHETSCRRSTTLGAVERPFASSIDRNRAPVCGAIACRAVERAG